MAQYETHRRAPENGDLVVIDYPDMNAICVVDGISEDPYENCWASTPSTSLRESFLGAFRLNPPIAGLQRPALH